MPATTGVPATATASERAALTFWLPDPGPEIGAAIRTLMQEAGAEAGSAITLVPIDGASFAQTEQAAIGGGTLPDLIVPLDVSGWVERGLARDVQDLFQTIGRAGGGWYDLVELTSRVEGRRIGVPLTIVLETLFMRQDLLAGAGVRLPFASFSELTEGLRRATRGAVHGLGLPFRSGASGPWLGLLFAHGGRLFAADGRPTFDTPRNRAGLTALRELVNGQPVVPAAAATWRADDVSAAYRGGQVAAMVESVFALGELRQRWPAVMAATTLEPWPAASAGQPAVVGDSIMLLINQRSPRAEPASQVVRQLFQPARYRRLLAATVDPPLFAPLKGFKDLDLYLNDPLYRRIQHELVPLAVAATAETSRTPLLAQLGPLIDQALVRVAYEGEAPATALVGLDRSRREPAPTRPATSGQRRP